MRRIEANEEIRICIEKYPHTRTTARTQERISKKGPDYLNFEIGAPLDMPRPEYEELTNQATACIRIYEKLCDIYQNDPSFKRLVKVLVLQFENRDIASMVEDYPIATLTGVRFGTDTMVDINGSFKTTEMNLGPVGGPPEAIRAEETQKDIEFPISATAYTDFFISSLDNFYKKSCETCGINPKPLEERKLAIVENDEWTTGNFIILDLLRRKNIQIDIAPREAFVYDDKENVLRLNTGDSNEIVDQLVLYFHLQDDFDSKDPAQAGNIVRAISNKAVVAETSVLPLIVFASKAMAGLISQIANNPDGLLSRRWNLNMDDLEAIKDMFPKTYHWRRKTFLKMEDEGLNRFDLLNYLKEHKLIPKSARSNYFAGMGVYGTDNKKGRKGYEEFYQALREEVFSLLIKRSPHILSKLFDEKFIPMLEEYIYPNDPNGLNKKDDKNTNIYYSIDALKYGHNDKLSALNLTKAQLESIQSLHNRINISHFNDQPEVEKFFMDLSAVLMEGLGVDINSGNRNRILKGLICYLSTYMILPFVMQKKIEPSIPNEYRSGGFVVNPPEKIVTMVSTLKRPEIQGDLKSVHVILPK
ncbi:hypothetical protein C4577_02460 [Candidatus Parcubacteria bacterium]|nr:MAG: hypothetical protein C4577_02460 [Candidatus Parcubacteria bacterium]